jgi:DNA-binding response OmpR family regulator
MNTPRLLLVDDNPSLLKLNNAIFSNEGFETSTAKDGNQAMLVLQNEHIDLIITDVLMPNVDGYYLCYKVRASEPLRNIPIIVYSGTYTSESEEKTARDMGADLFIRKPASSKTLILSVRTLLENPPRHKEGINASPESFEVMHQYSSSLINKLEDRNHELEEIKIKLEQLVDNRTMELRQANDDLKTLNEELTTANEELNSSNESLAEKNMKIENLHRQLVEVNENLEYTVELRTAALKHQNKHLEEYAFFTAHNLRAPLARILGLVHLLKKDFPPNEQKLMLEHLVKSSEELDQIIRSISHTLQKGITGYEQQNSEPGSAGTDLGNS